jgi:hypothetical protein
VARESIGRCSALRPLSVHSPAVTALRETSGTAGTAVTDATGHAVISFFAPANEGTAQVVVLAGNASGSTPLTIAK